MKAIMAMAKNRAIGLNNQLPWGTIYKEDFQWFKEFTMGKTLIVGWYTFNSLPRLKGRKGVVLNKMWDGNIIYYINNAPFYSFIMNLTDYILTGINNRILIFSLLFLTLTISIFSSDTFY